MNSTSHTRTTYVFISRLSHESPIIPSSVAGLSYSAARSGVKPFQVLHRNSLRRVFVRNDLLGALSGWG